MIRMIRIIRMNQKITLLNIQIIFHIMNKLEIYIFFLYFMNYIISF